MVGQDQKDIKNEGRRNVLTCSRSRKQTKITERRILKETGTVSRGNAGSDEGPPGRKR